MRPNILMFMTDNQPAELLGCYGNTEIHTPHIDAFAADAFQFDNAFCVNGMCSPCRASVMTGLMPSQHGIHTWIDDRLRNRWPENWNALDEFRTLPAILADNGYKTALIGKYHMGAPESPQNGFQHWVTYSHGHVRRKAVSASNRNVIRQLYDPTCIDNCARNYQGTSRGNPQTDATKISFGGFIDGGNCRNGSDRAGPRTG